MHTYPMKPGERYFGNPADHPSVICWWVKPVPLHTGTWPQPKKITEEWGHEVYTADGVEIEHDLLVMTNDLDIGRVDLERRKPYSETNQNNGHVEWWFYVSTDRGYVLQSESRVSTIDIRTGRKL